MLFDVGEDGFDDGLSPAHQPARLLGFGSGSMVLHGGLPRGAFDDSRLGVRGAFGADGTLWGMGTAVPRDVISMALAVGAATAVKGVALGTGKAIVRLVVAESRRVVRARRFVA